MTQRLFQLQILILAAVLLILLSACENDSAEVSTVSPVPASTPTCTTVDVSGDTSHLTLLGSKKFGPAGGELLLTGTHADVGWFRITVPEGALSCETEIQVYHSTQIENAPPGFIRLSPVIELWPRDLTFALDISVILPYDDEDQDGVVDGSSVSELKLYPAYYSFDNQAWGPLEALVPDTGSNVAGFEANRLASYTLWGALDSTVDSYLASEASMYIIGNDWYEDPTSTETSVINRMAQYNLNKLFVHVYEPSSSMIAKGEFIGSTDGNPLPAGITTTLDYFSLSTLITEAQVKGIEIIPVITCFGYGQPDEEDHKTHLLEVIDYFVNTYPQIDGLMLDFIRFNEEVRSVTASFQNPELVTAFVKEIKLGHSGSLPLFLSVWDHASTYRELLLGQRLADLSAVSDYLCPMLYSGTQTETFDSRERIKEDIHRVALTRNSSNNIKIMTILSTYGEITPTSLNGHLAGSLEAGSDGVGLFRFALTDADEWSVISQYLTAD